MVTEEVSVGEEVEEGSVEEEVVTGAVGVAEVSEVEGVDLASMTHHRTRKSPSIK